MFGTIFMIMHLDIRLHKWLQMRNLNLILHMRYRNYVLQRQILK